jgi:MFS superfamily sulfate permease-like transporter
MKSKKLVLVGGAIVLGIAISVFFIFNTVGKKEKMEKKTGTNIVTEKEKEKAIKAMEEQIKILADEQKTGQLKQDEILKEYEAKIYKEIDKNRRILLIKEMVDIVGVHGIDASAIPKLDEIKNKISDGDEKKIITDKIKMILRNRDMFAELEEYEKHNQ